MTRYAIFVFALFLSSVVLNAQVVVPKEVQGDEEYINWWKSPVPKGAENFIIHPSGNIIAHFRSHFYDIDGVTGDSIRTFDYYEGYQGMSDFRISPDGKYFGYVLYGQKGVVLFIYDYATGKLVLRKDNTGYRFRFLGDSDLFMIENEAITSLEIYKINGDLVKSITRVFFDYEVSPDGKYIVALKRDELADFKTLVELWDAQTFTKIKTLEKFKGELAISDVQFSHDGKYMSYKIQPLLDTYIYRVSDFELVRRYDIGSVAFLENDLIAITGVVNENLENAKAYFAIQDLGENINDNLFKSDTLGGIPTRYNKAENSIIMLHTASLLSANLSKILAKVSVSETPNSNLLIDYSNRTLTIRNLDPILNGKSAKIFDIQGNIVFQFPIQSYQNGIFSIPISLQVGAYILSIDEQAYKFLVVE